jgi:hypothetical protein
MQVRKRYPDFKPTERALRSTTTRLAQELVQPTPAAPSWDDFEWDIARAVAAMQGVSALLERHLIWRGPERWQAFLLDQREQGVKRDLRIAALIAALDECLRRENIPVVGLKGSALRVFRVYPVGDRPMGDIDLLAREADFPAVSRALDTLGFAAAYTTRRHAVFTDCPLRAAHDFGEHIDNPLKIELHSCIAEALPITTVDITARLWPAPAAAGMNPYQDTGALLAHLLLHCAGNMRAHALRLIQLHDIARLLPHMGADDWAKLLRPRRPADGSWWMLPPLLLAQRYAGALLPSDVHAELLACCPPRLARAARRFTLHEVSWSNLRIAAFPGIEWSQSFGESLRYARTRIIPDSEARAEVALWAQVHPQIQGIPWYEVPHMVRILRWVFSSPPRVQTMNSVLAALASEGRPSVGAI